LNTKKRSKESKIQQRRKKALIVFLVYPLYLLKNLVSFFKAIVVIKCFRVKSDSTTISLRAMKNLSSRYCTFSCRSAATKLAISMTTD